MWQTHEATPASGPQKLQNKTKEKQEEVASLAVGNEISVGAAVAAVWMAVSH